MKKLGKYGVVILLIVAAIFNVIVFAFPHQYKSSFWWGYGFTMFAVLSQIGIAVMAFGKSTSLEKTFMGLSISQLGFAYMIVQTIWGLAVTFIPNIPTALSAVGSVIILAVYAIMIIATQAGKDLVEETGQRVKEKTSFIKNLVVEFDILTEQITETETKRLLRALADKARYSDPMSNAFLTDIEGKITEKLLELQQEIKDENSQAIENLCRDLERLLAERARKCKLLK